MIEMNMLIFEPREVLIKSQNPICKYFYTTLRHNFP